MSEISILAPSVLLLALSLWCGILTQGWSSGILAMSYMRLNFLANPTRATAKYCQAVRTEACVLNIRIHMRELDGISNWRDLCDSDAVVSWGLPRLVRMGMGCQSNLGFATVEFAGPQFEFLSGY